MIYNNCERNFLNLAFYSFVIHLFVDKRQDDISSESGPSSSRGDVSQNCVFCNGRAGFLSNDDLKAKLTEKGLKTIIDVCQTRDDEPSKIILKKDITPPLTFLGSSKRHVEVISFTRRR